jgi:hypothetical protein
MHVPTTPSTTTRIGLGFFTLSVVLLSACGGGDPISVQRTPTTPVLETYVTSSGAATPAFVPNGNLRYLILGPDKDTLGVRSNTALQDQFGGGVPADIDIGPSGEVIRLGTNSLADVSASNKYAVQKIAGDASFAQGRWSKGLVTNAGGTVTLTGTDNQAFHYLAFNALTAFPVGVATRTCTSLKETGATYVGDTRIGETTTVGVAALGGEVKIEFDGLGNATVPINVVAAAKYPVPSFTPTVSEPPFLFTILNAAKANGDFEISRSFNGPGLGYMVVMGAGDAAGLGDVILLGVAYRVVLDSGFNYQGIISLRCS